MSQFERYLTLWVLLCIITGIGLGHWVPDVFQSIGTLEVAHINLPVALLIWLMIIPMLEKIDEGNHAVFSRHRRHIVGELADEAVLDGTAGGAIHRRMVPTIVQNINNTVNGIYSSWRYPRSKD